jgi:hypothetical protein
MEKCVGVVVLGAGGYMGSKSINALGIVSKRLRLDNLELKILIVADSDSRVWSTAANLCLEYTGKLPMAVPRLEEALPLLSVVRGGEHNPIIIYDAAPSSRHYGHLLAILPYQSSHIFYLGEKPIFLDLHQKERIQRTPDHQDFFCELIETENPVFKSVNNFLLSRTDIRVERLSFWRAGASGIKKAICVGRDGVEGGALEDKCLHDFSISLGFLGGPRNVLSASAQDAEIHHLILSNSYYLEDGKKEFLTVRNGSTAKITTDLENKAELPADGLFSTSVQWQVMDADKRAVRSVPGEYLFSWVGYGGHPKELEFVRKLTTLGLPHPDDRNPGAAELRWLDSSSASGPGKDFYGEGHSSGNDPEFRAELQEVRVGIIECTTPTGSMSIVCNFLSKYGKINRFAVTVENTKSGPKINQTLYYDNEADRSASYDQKKETDLAEVLYSVIRYALGDDPPQLLGRRATLLVHDLMLQAQDKAFRKLATRSTDTEFWFQETLPVFEKHIARVRKQST